MSIASVGVGRCVGAATSVADAAPGMGAPWRIWFTPSQLTPSAPIASSEVTTQAAGRARRSERTRTRSRREAGVVTAPANHIRRADPEAAGRSRGAGTRSRRPLGFATVVAMSTPDALHPSDGSEPRVEHRPGESRFVLVEDGRTLGELSYVEGDDAITIEHTIVDPDRQGEGLAARLSKAAFAELGEGSRKRIVPACTYAAQYVRKHPELLPLTQR